MGIVVLNDFRAEPGGGTAVARFCAEGLFRRGHDVVYVAGDAPQGLTQDGPGGCRQAGLGLVDIRKHGKATRIADAIHSRLALQRLQELLREHPPEDSVILLHQWTRVLSPAVFDALRGHRVMVFAHDYFLFCPNGAFFHFPTGDMCEMRPMGPSCVVANCDRESRAHKIVRLLRQGVQDRAVARMDDLQVICVSEGQRERFGSLFARAGLVISLPNPPVGTLPEVAEMKESDASDDLPFLFVGRLTSEKGLRHAIEACRGVGRRLRVVGDGAGRSDLQREFPDVTFEGWLTHAEVLRAMRQACAVLVPSLWAETSALVAHEAVSVGSPVVVSSRICAASELVASGCAIAVDPADQSAFQAALRQMMDPLQRRMFRRAAEERARQTSAPMLQEAYLSRLEELVGRQTSDAATGTRGT